MTIYRCRFLKPSVGEWYDVEADSPGEAALEHHNRFDGIGYVFWKPLEGGGQEVVRFASVDVEVDKDYVTRMFSMGIYRKGAFNKNRGLTLQEIAKKLDWKHDENELLGDGWEAEEGYS